MRATAAGLAGVLLLATTPLFAQQLQPPAAPVVTVSANIRELIFDWERVPTAYTYWLMEKKDASSPFVAIGTRIPGGRPRAAVAVAVHLQNWQEARYAVSACNLAGCTRSAEINPQHLMSDTIGYFKASNTDPEDLFGVVALSGDASTLAVGALWESSNATGVNGNQADNSSPRSGAVYVFRRDGRRWRQEAYLKAGVNQPNQGFGGFSGLSESIALSGDGSWLAVGAAADDVQGVVDAGTVYLFHREPDGTWTQQTTLHAPQLMRAAQFGRSIDMTEDGRMIKVTALGPSDDDVYTDENTPVYFYERHASGWQLSATLVPAYPGYNCGAGRMSIDGTTLLAYCGSELLVPGERLLTFKRSGSTWTQVSDLIMADTFAHQPMAISHDAMRMALVEGPQVRNVVMHRWSGNQWVREAVVSAPFAVPGEPSQASWGIGIQFNGSGTLAGIYASGVSGLFLFERTSNSQERWKLRSTLAQPNPDRDNSFGLPFALSASGRYLAVGAFREDSNARGIDGDRTNNDAEDSGAVYLY